MAFNKKAGLNRGSNHGPAPRSLESVQYESDLQAPPAKRVIEFIADISIADAKSFGLVAPNEVSVAEASGYAEWRTTDEDFLQVYHLGQRVGLVMDAATARRRHSAFLVFLTRLLERGQQ